MCKDIDDFITATNAASAWPEFKNRINTGMKDGSTAGSRSGDILLIMNVEAGFKTIVREDELNGWHGGPTAAEGQVPLIFNFLGADKSFIENAIPAGSLRNFQLAPIIEGIIDAVRD